MADVKNEVEFDLTRAVAVYGFIPPKEGKKDEAGICYEALCVRDRILLGQDPGDWLPANIFRKLTYDYSLDEEDEGGTEVDEKEAEKWMDPEDKAYTKFLNALDPTKWKDQDHYRVLGLRRLRYSATEKQIKAAYRAKVVYHHPDKRRQRGEMVKDGNEDYFTCITRAYETLSNRSKRRAYDSVDPHFKDSTPTLDEAKKQKDNFFGLFRPVFENNARWSTVQPVPGMGEKKSSIDEVNDFYSFWFEFTSWREFSYLDEEDKDKGENRDERRWIERQNKSERDRRRKEETKRIRTLVETAYAVDPRVLKFKEDEKRKKDEEKAARREAQQRKKEEERLRREAEEQAEKERIEAEQREAKAKRDEERKEKEQKKKAFNKQKKLLQAFCKEMEYFETAEDLRMERMEQMTKMCTFSDTDNLRILNEKLRASSNGSTPRDTFLKFFTQLESTLASEAEQAESRLKESKRADEAAKEASVAVWSPDELSLLVKAASSVYPVGSRARYEMIAGFINEHRKDFTDPRPKTAKDVIGKAKGMQSLETTAKDLPVNPSLVVNKKGATHQNAEITQVPQGEATSDWSNAEQKLLEEALRKFPSSTPQRWDRIAEQIPNRTKKDCMKRYKELAELVKAKRAAAEGQIK